MEGLHLEEGTLRKLLQEQKILVAFVVGMEEWKDLWNIYKMALIEIWDLLHGLHRIKEKVKNHIKFWYFSMNTYMNSDDIHWTRR